MGTGRRVRLWLIQWIISQGILHPKWFSEKDFKTSSWADSTTNTYNFDTNQNYKFESLPVFSLL